MKKQQSGFTLIELIMVIVVLGILSAFALPRFVNLGGDARAATLQGAFANMKSASAMVHSSYLAKNGSATAVTVEGGNQVAVVAGYPAAKATSATVVGIVEAAGLDTSDFQPVYAADNKTVYVHPKGVVALTAADITDSAKVAAHGCVIIYAETTGAPSINVQAGDCSK